MKRFRSVLNKHGFRALYGGVTLSRVGDTMSFVVISWVALGIGGPQAVGLVMFMGGVVTPVAGPLIGHLLDRAGLRWLMLIDNASRCALMIGLSEVVRQGHVRLWYLLAFAAVNACLSPATEIGQNVGIPMLVGPDELDAANVLMSSSWSVAAWIGPAFAGFAIGFLGSANVLLIDAGTFAVMCLVALAMPRHAEQSPQEESGGALAKIFLGFRVLWQLRPVLLLTIVGLADLLLAGMMEVFLPAFNKLTLHDGPGQYGLLVSIAGVSCLIGTLFFTPLALRLGHTRALVAVLALRGLTILPLAFIGSWGLAAVFVALSSIPDGSGMPISRTIQQRLVPKHLRGRVQGARSALGIAGFPLGSAIGGLLIAGIGAGPSAGLMAAGYMVLAVSVVLSPALRTLTPLATGPAEAGLPASAEG